MLFSFPVIRRIFLMLMLASLLILSYLLHEMLLKTIALSGPQGSSTRQSGKAYDQDFCLKLMEDRFCEKGQTDPCRTNVQKKKEEEVNNILARLDQQMPSVTFTDIKSTTSAKNSKATLLNRKDSYCVGEHLLVQLDLYDYLGKKKEYGGDFLRARIFSQNLKAGASGHIKDYRNGTYLVNFTLFWEGKVRVSVLLIHPSEAVSALWAARKKGYDKIAFVGRFLNGTSDVSTECGFRISTNSELCEYGDEQDQEAFYCVKPKNLPCEAFVRLMTNNKPVSYLTVQEQSLLTRDKIGVEIPQRFGEIQVLSCNRSARMAREKCRIGMGSPIPSGYALHNAWYPQFCSVSNFSTLDKIHACLKRKMIYLMGDSTLRQWIYSLTEKVATLKFFDYHGAGVFKTHVAMDLERNTFIQWKKHGHPFVSKKLFSVKDSSYISSEIARVAGDEDTAIVITLGQHFRPFPMHIFVRQLLDVRRAIRHLLLRSPGTRVVIRAENIRELDIESERFGDINGFPQNLIIRDIFQGLDVGFIDAWDMSIAYAVNNVHPPKHVVWNQIIMFLTYIC
ncbi:NXPE family member 2 isoform X1 [Python bivittatus]|uniref:NXPE family member 2 isoform X1 n=1 Tax=Python bivittatus TaxID=176946 RepID=A0A9F2R777_PYTBI|nr:NXPE family member 2 isoform X1 [Python bivittatus]